MQTLFKILPLLLGFLLAKPAVAQNSYAQLIFYNNSSPNSVPQVFGRVIRRSPYQQPMLPVCYFDGETITITSNNEEFVLPYYIKEENGVKVLSGTITVTPAMSITIDVSMLPAGYYQLVVGFDQNYYASFERE